ncbi:hypothetical protein PYJP_07050 [Pyrofollis japonicus]|uniref:NADH-quinone oxidoreductase subunit J family protein n=1 Tax=Pyrofollis japonicus TaxID=3060460 RepID=UPI00295AF9DE|nr:NADH-quinone oxidoreductase subunit J [Pyrofollis japonicus]BEP17353.1 hypothetical protein PYJP_07050 [Pyrofollis japonicus]
MNLSSNLLVDSAIVGSLTVLALSAIGTVVAKRTMKAVFMLGIAALSVAGLMALMGYSYLAAFYVVVYAGTTITLLAFIVMMLGDLYEEAPRKPDLLLLSIITAAALGAPILFYASRHPVPSSEIVKTKYGLADAARFFTDCWLCTILILVTIAAVLIEAVSIARKSQA